MHKITVCGVAAKKGNSAGTNPNMDTAILAQFKTFIGLRIPSGELGNP